MTTSRMHIFSSKSRSKWSRHQKDVNLTTSPNATNEDIYSKIPLGVGSRSNIRLVKLELSPVYFDKDKVSCQLYVMPLESSPPYVAVSYVWGDTADTKTIRLNNKSYTVRASLFAFLRKMNYQDYDGFLWIDALCIDQTSNAERSHQVAIMGDIYSRASETLVWLHPETNNLRRAIRYLAGFQPDAAQTTHESAGEFWDDIPYAGMLELCRHPYWTRAWIVQEFILSPKITLCCGMAKADARVLVFLWHTPPKAWDRSKVESICGTLSFSKATRLQKYRALQKSYKKSFRPWLLLQFGIMECADVRDRVYSLVSLMDPDGTITPDYDKSASDLFAELVRQQHDFDEGYIEEAMRGLQQLLDIPNDDPTMKALLAQGHVSDAPSLRWKLESIAKTTPLWLWFDEERLIALSLSAERVLELNTK